jgi:hypothetical protein
MEFNMQINFITTLLKMAEESCTRVIQTNDEGIEHYLFEPLLESPQLHASLNALHITVLANKTLGILINKINILILRVFFDKSYILIVFSC